MRVRVRVRVCVRVAVRVGGACTSISIYGRRVCAIFCIVSCHCNALEGTSTSSQRRKRFTMIYRCKAHGRRAALGAKPDGLEPNASNYLLLTSFPRIQTMLAGHRPLMETFLALQLKRMVSARSTSWATTSAQNFLARLEKIQAAARAGITTASCGTAAGGV